MATYLEQSLAKLEEFEGAISWMYRDTVGKVTVGVGRMLPDAAAARSLAFRIGERAATPDEITAEFARVRGLPMARPASFYRRPGAPELDRATMDELLRTVLLDFETKLRGGITGYDTLPDTVKLALLDMAYNLGPAGLLHGFPHLIQAVESGAWAKAAAGCSRRGPSAARNEWTRQMFLANVVGKVEAVAESLAARFLYGVVGLLSELFAPRAR